MLVKAKVIAVESFGAIVQFSSGVKALCPLPHMSEFEILKPSKKFQACFDLLFLFLSYPFGDPFSLEYMLIMLGTLTDWS